MKNIKEIIKKALNREKFDKNKYVNCTYPDCLDNEDERCVRWLTGYCKGPQ